MRVSRSAKQIAVVPAALIVAAVESVMLTSSNNPVARSAGPRGLGVQAAQGQCVVTNHIDIFGNAASAQDALNALVPAHPDVTRLEVASDEVRFVHYEGTRPDKAYRVVRDGSGKWLVSEIAQSAPCDKAGETNPYVNSGS